MLPTRSAYGPECRKSEQKKLNYISELCYLYASPANLHDELQPVTQPVSHLSCDATLRVTGTTAWHGFQLRVRTRTGRCLHKMYKEDEANSGGEAPHPGYCSGSSNLEESRSCIRFSIGRSTLSFSRDDGGPVPYHS